MTTDVLTGTVQVRVRLSTSSSGSSDDVEPPISDSLSVGQAIEKLQGLGDLVALFGYDDVPSAFVIPVRSAGRPVPENLGPFGSRRVIAAHTHIDSMSYNSPWEIRLRLAQLPQAFRELAEQWNQTVTLGLLSARSNRIAAREIVGARLDVIAGDSLRMQRDIVSRDEAFPRVADEQIIRTDLLESATKTLSSIEEIVVEHGWFA